MICARIPESDGRGPRMNSGNRVGRTFDYTTRKEVTVLHKTSELRGYHILATDGEIGHVDDFLIEERDRTLRYLVVDTSNWIGGRSVLISAIALDRIDVPAKKIHVNLTREAIERSPSVDTADIDPAETLPALWIM
jgi:sporulation protein YlmC with PRC-barrel domain